MHPPGHVSIRTLEHNENCQGSGVVELSSTSWRIGTFKPANRSSGSLHDQTINQRTRIQTQSFDSAGGPNQKDKLRFLLTLFAVNIHSIVGSEPTSKTLLRRLLPIGSTTTIDGNFRLYNYYDLVGEQVHRMNNKKTTVMPAPWRIPIDQSGAWVCGSILILIVFFWKLQFKFYYVINYT